MTAQEYMRNPREDTLFPPFRVSHVHNHGLEVSHKTFCTLEEAEEQVLVWMHDLPTKIIVISGREAVGFGELLSFHGPAWTGEGEWQPITRAALHDRLMSCLVCPA